MGVINEFGVRCLHHFRMRLQPDKNQKNRQQKVDHFYCSKFTANLTVFCCSKFTASLTVFCCSKFTNLTVFYFSKFTANLTVFYCSKFTANLTELNIYPIFFVHYFWNDKNWTKNETSHTIFEHRYIRDRSLIWIMLSRDVIALLQFLCYI